MSYRDHNDEKRPPLFPEGLVKDALIFTGGYLVGKNAAQKEDDGPEEPRRNVFQKMGHINAGFFSGDGENFWLRCLVFAVSLIYFIPAIICSLFLTFLALCFLAALVGVAIKYCWLPLLIFTLFVVSAVAFGKLVGKRKMKMKAPEPTSRFTSIFTGQYTKSTPDQVYLLQNNVKKLYTPVNPLTSVNR